MLKTPLTFLIALLLLGSACGTPAPVPPTATATPAAPSASQLFGTSWSLSQLRGNSLIAGTHIGLEFTANFLGGEMTCNGYGHGPDSGKYTAADDGSFKIIGLAVTVVLCEPEGLARQEDTYIATLQQAATFRVTGDRLEFYDQDGAAILVFDRQTSP